VAKALMMVLDLLWTGYIESFLSFILPLCWRQLKN